MTKSILWRSRRRRFFVSASRWLLLVVPPLATAMVGAIFRANASLPTLAGLTGLLWWIVGGAVIGLLLLVVQAYFEYQRRTYDPTWVLKYQERFDDETMQRLRSTAARVLKERQGRLRSTESQLSDIDEVLDFFEDLGFYERGDQISPECAHHHFFHWIRGYYQASRDYIEAWQEKEAARWAHVPEIFETTFAVEDEVTKGRCKRFLDANELATFLEDEIDLVEPETK